MREIEQRSIRDPLFPDISPEQIAEWIHEENIQKRKTRIFQGFELVESLDGGFQPEREVTLVRILRPGEYPQHVHKNSDAVFFIVSGKATLTSGDTRRDVQAGNRIEIPRGMPHGFETEEGEQFAFLSVQSPPILNRKTGEEDFHLYDKI